MKRFSETDKWKDSWFRKLSPTEKLLWLYIVDNCDNAGFFEMDIDMCEFFTGLNETEISGAIKGLSRGLIGAKKTELYFVRTFLRHQKNDNLNSSNNAHKQIIRLINEKESLFDENLGAMLGLNSPTGKGKGKGLGSIKKEKGYTDDFEKFWSAYPKKTGKGAAFKSWENSKSKPVIEDVIAMIESLCTTEDWKKQNGQFIPMPATWLNQKRWDDVVGVVTKKQFVQNGKTFFDEPLCDDLTREQHLEKYGSLDGK